MSAELHLPLANDFNELPGSAEKITEFLEGHGASPDIVFAANLAVEELVTNIIKYGYDDQDAHVISLCLKIADGTLHIEIVDDGHEFDPFDRPAPDITLSAEERQIGGLGIHFVKNMLDSHLYERRDDRNIVTLTKKL